MMKILLAVMTLLRTGGGRLFALAAALPVLAVLLAGCGEPVAIYHAPRDYLAEGRTVLILPFMDTRTFVDERDPHREDVGIHVRDIFAASIRDNTVGMDLELLTPAMDAPTRSMTNAEVAEIGRDHGADVVVAGQVFSFTDTRAASIPPRAGMFVRVISTRDGALLFVGDHYQAAAVPGASGGRDQQAVNVANRLVEGFLSKARPMLGAAGRVASSAALASLAPPLGMGVSLIGHIADESGATENDDGMFQGEPLPGFVGQTLLNPDEWDEQIIPEVPPLLDFGDDFYQAALPDPAPAVAPVAAARPEEYAPLAAPSLAEPLAEPSTAVALPVRADTAPVFEQSTPDLGPLVSEVLPEEDGDFLLPEFPMPLDDMVPGGETAPAADAAGSLRPDAPAVSDEVAVSPPRVEAEPGTEDNPTVAETPESPMPAPESRAVEYPDTSAIPAMAAAEPEAEPTFVDGVVARVIDELPEMDFASVDKTLLEEERQAIAAADAMSGDDLAADLFDSEDDMIRNAARQRRRPQRIADAVRNGTPETMTPQAASGGAVAVPVHDPAHFGPFEFDPDTLELRNPLPRQPAPAPAAGVAAGMAAGFGEDGGGPVISTPLASEQPRTYRGADVVELPADPALASLDEDALVAAPLRNARPGAVRLLVLPYHDRPNTNNLIDNTGGGEVVTTLYGTQLALDPNIQLMWDASGQATHTRLLTREEAVRMGRLAGAEYVIRGQVVEFRRAQSVPSFYSAVISTAVLAAQMVFAEMSGVDVATEVYRVSDGVCVMARRDRSQQKYVVQAEKTVRRMAVPMAESVSAVVRGLSSQPMDPLIDELAPVTAMAH